MPPRSSSRAVATPPLIATSGAPPASDASVRRAHLYVCTSLSLLWVVLLSVSFGLALAVAILFNTVRIDKQEQRHLATRINSVQAQVATINRQLIQAQRPTPPQTGRRVPQSPSGALTRGSLSPDGTKYAGYEDVVKGKIGLSVESVDSQKVKRIEIFNPTIESTGAGTQLESSMSVRWKDNQTIEYDVLVKKQGVERKEIRNAKIFF